MVVAFLSGISNSIVSIIDNEFAPGVIGFARTNFNVFENAGFAELTLVRTNGFSGVVSVGFVTAGSVIPLPPPFPASPSIDFALTNGSELC